MSKKGKIRVLYIDDEKNNLISFKANFRIDFDVFTAESASEGLEILAKQKMHIIITDQRMPVMTGVEFLENVMRDYPEPVRILLTGYTDLETVIEAVNKGKIYQYVRKPYDGEELRKLIHEAFEHYQQTEALKRTNEQLEFVLRQKLLS